VLRIIVETTDSRAFAAGAQESPDTTFKTFDIDHPELELMLRSIERDPLIRSIALGIEVLA